MSTSLTDACAPVVAGDAFVIPGQSTTERAEDLARIIRILSGNLGLTGDLAEWLQGQGAEHVLADLETLSRTVAQLRALVSGGAA